MRSTAQMVAGRQRPHAPQGLINPATAGRLFTHAGKITKTIPHNVTRLVDRAERQCDVVAFETLKSDKDHGAVVPATCLLEDRQ